MLFNGAEHFESKVGETKATDQIYPDLQCMREDLLEVQGICPSTTNTTRPCGQDFYETQITSASMVMAGHQVVSVYLASAVDFPQAVIGAPLQHHPAEGPLLLTRPNQLDPPLGRFMKMLNPSGNMQSQVVLVGDLSDQVERQVQSLGFSVERIRGRDVFETAHLILDRLGRPQDIILINTNPDSGGQVAASFAAHMGLPILLTEGPVLPFHTRLALQSVRNPNVYIVGISGSIPERTINEVRRLAGFVDFIGGNNLFELAVNFSGYKSPVSDFGWGKDHPHGHAFSFVLPGPWQFLVSSLGFSHRGKHTPFLYVNSDNTPAVTLNYVRQVNPLTIDRPPFMHGFIIGNRNVINNRVQTQLQIALSIEGNGMLHSMGTGSTSGMIKNTVNNELENGSRNGQHDG